MERSAPCFIQFADNVCRVNARIWEIVAKAAKPQKPPPMSSPEAVAAYHRERNPNVLRPPNGIGVTRRTPNLERLFTDSLAEGYSVTASAWAIGVSRQTSYAWRGASEATRQEDGTYTDDFCVRWDDAVEAGVDRLEDEAERRARRGVEKPVYQGGVMVGTVTEYSDTLMQFMLKGKRPQKHNVERHELSGPGGAPIATTMEIEFVDVKLKDKVNRR